MKKLFILFVAMVFASGAMAQSETIDVRVNIEEYATLTVIQPQIELTLTDVNDAFSWPADGHLMAQLELNANYETELQVDPVTLLTIGTTEFVGLTGPGGAELGAWPQITGPVISGQSLFAHNGTFPLVMDGQYREEAGANANGLTMAGEGIPTGTTIVNVGVSTNWSNTPDGEWAPQGEYNGQLTVTVVPYTP